MKQKSNGFVVIMVVLGLAAASYTSNQLYNWKTGIAPHEAKAPTQFYAGMEKFLSNISWMTLVQWQADELQRMTPERAEALYAKLNALTNLDPLFTDAYVDGALSLATYKPDLSLKLLDKGMMMGLQGQWRVPFYAGHISLANGTDMKKAEQYFQMALNDKDVPDYVQSALVRAKCLGVSEAPVESMRFWHDYYVTLSTDKGSQRQLAASQIRSYADAARTDVSAKLQAASDAAAREAVAKDRDWVASTMKDIDAKFPAGPDNDVEPTTAPTTAPMI